MSERLNVSGTPCTNKRNIGSMQINCPCPGYDSASSVLGSGIGDINWGSLVLWTVLNMSSVQRPHNSQIRATLSGCMETPFRDYRLGMDRWFAITLRQPRVCLARRTMSCECNHRNMSIK